MTTFDDKILGIKKDYYCSSSESEDDSDSSQYGEAKSVLKNPEENEYASAPEPTKWEGSAKNTGPKGVIRDWQRYKQLQTEKREEQELERMGLAKRLTLTTSKDQTNDEDEDKALLELIDDDMLLQYQKQRMEEMMSRPTTLPRFGAVISLKSGNDFLEAIDNENKSVTIIIHIYEESNLGCKTMNKCLSELSKQYPSVKFCKIVGSSAGMSQRFKVEGVPALLVYKEGSVIGNFVRVTDELGDEFYEGDVENFLIEHGIINDRFCVPSIIQNEEDGEDNVSDWSLE